MTLRSNLGACPHCGGEHARERLCEAAEEPGGMLTSREVWKLSPAPVSTAVEVPEISDPESDDPELGRARLYPMWGDQKLYGEPQSREEERRQDMECLQADYYWRQGDTQGQIAHCLAILTERPNDLAIRYHLGRLYLEIGDAEKVIEVIGAAHRAYPRLLDFQDLLLDALSALGQDEADFEWATELRIFRLDGVVTDRCYEFLKRKRRPRSAFELEARLSLEGCCRFTQSELLEALARDERFIVDNRGVLRRSGRAAPSRSRRAARSATAAARNRS